MAQVKNVCESNFRAVVEASAIPVLVDFYAEWCGPCKLIQPEIEALAQETDTVTVAKVNVDENNNLAERFGINNIPCMILFENGEPKKTIVGYRTKQQLKTIITEK